MKKLNLTMAMVLLCLFGIFEAKSQQLAFPGAEGYGRFATGGRGGSVYHVTNLNDSGAGSFRDAVSGSNRIVVFDVSGVINISSRIVINRNVTVAGQTAPGGGITIYGNGIALNGSSGNNIIRYIRIRMGKNGDSGKDAVGISEGQNYMFDHVSISWGRDGTLDVNGSGIDNLTFQDCIVSQGINNSNHSTGGLMQSGKWSIIRSLYIDNKTRNPKARGTQEFINSVLYNWGSNGYIMGDTEGVSECNMIGNYFIYGPSSSDNAHITRTTPTFYVYTQDNWVDADKDGVLDGSLLTDYKTATVMSTPFNRPGVNNLLSAQQAVANVIENAGASLVRDEVDELLINQVSSYGTQGSIILTEDDNGISGNVGYVAGGTAPTDTDQDGMPDYWETDNGTNPYSADHNGDMDGDGYTNIEEYLEWIIDGDVVVQPAELIKHGAGSSSQSVALGESITDFYYNWVNASGVTVSGLPSGVTSTVNTSAQSVTISGTPTEAGTFNYTINTTGGSPNTSIGGTFTVTSNVSTVTIEENTTGFCSVDGSVDNNNAGFTGSGFANTDNAAGNGVDWKVNFLSASTKTFVFRYASGSDRPANLIIDGSTVASNINFPSTGSWTTWSTVTVTAYTSAGTMDMRLQATGSSGLGNIDNVTITDASAASCNAVITYTLSASANGSGSVNPSSGTYNSGDVVSVTASPSSGYQFDGWSGDASGTSSTINITMNANKFITANFSQIPVTYTLSVTTNGSGSVSTSGGIYNSGDVVSVTATPSSGYQFDGWSGDASGTSNPVSITMNANKSVTANFSAMPETTITIQENTTGFCSVDGTVDNNNGGFTGTGFANTSNALDQGISWTINALISGNYTFSWQLANGGSTDRSANLLVDGSVNVSNVSFPSTGSWTSWAGTSNVSTYLSAGNRVIRLQATTSSGLANIDYITVTGIQPSPVSCVGVKSASVMSDYVSESNFSVDMIGDKHNILSAKYNLTQNAEVNISVYSIMGKLIYSSDLGDFEKGAFNENIELENLQSGVYIVRAKFGSDMQSAKVIKY